MKKCPFIISQTKHCTFLCVIEISLNVEISQLICNFKTNQINKWIIHIKEICSYKQTKALSALVLYIYIYTSKGHGGAVKYTASAPLLFKRCIAIHLTSQLTCFHWFSASSECIVTFLLDVIWGEIFIWKNVLCVLLFAQLYFNICLGKNWRAL